MEGLPKLPGLDFSNKLKTRHHVSHCFDYHNGYTHVRPPLTAIGNEPPTEQSVAFLEREDAILYDPVLTYGRVKVDPPMPFRPKYVLFDKMTLTFRAFFKQHVTESPKEHYRIRHVNILYFLEDDSITVMEPTIKNSGITHGRLIRRGKIAKNISGEVYSWKDLNIGMDLDLNGIVFHITDCDQFTKDFMASQGVELNDAECTPGDPVNIERQAARIPCKPPSKKTPDDKLRRFLAFQGKVLKFDCILDESDRPSGEVMTYQMLYFLEDDTVSIKELKENREGRDRFPMMLSRQKLPKNWKCRPLDYPSIFLERGEDEIQEYYTPQDFRVGETIYVYGRRFLLLDCDKFTRNYFENVLRIPQKEKLLIKFPEKKMAKLPIPDYLGLGTPEDSLTSCFGLIPKQPKKDVIKYLLNTNKFLRYGCILDSAHPEDSIRKFVLSYSLSDDQIKIVEPPIRNSGIWGGKYLLPMRVKRPGCDPNNPEYYGPKDFYIGATLEIFDHRFKIVSVDLYVWKFMQQNPEFFTPEAIESVRQFIEEEEKKKSKVVYKDCKDINLGDPNCECPDPVPALEKNLQDIMVHDDVNNRPIENIEQKVRDEHPTDDAKACPYEVQPAEEECGLII